ncbi:hypothetical protein [Actinoplanes sp. URMC 104]|uniref:phasin family protein n=1 Tax=Actinoplanes sp. URMC 104 TaxID=3423409 RepID=UPI003F1E1D53
MPDAWRAYLEMALGLTETPRKRAQKVAGELVNRGGATAAQLQGLVDDLLSAGMANREALTNIVRYEVDRALGVVGLATAEEVTELTDRVRDLERQLREAQSRAAGDAGADIDSEPTLGGSRIEQPAPVPRRTAKKAVAKKAAPNRMPAAGTTPSTPQANIATVSEPPAKKAVAKKAGAKKAVAKAPDEVLPPEKRATAKVAPATVEAEEQGTPAQQAAAKRTVAKKAVAKKAANPEAPAKKAAKKAAAKKAAPGTADSPTAGVRDAAAATELPPAPATEPQSPEAGDR